MHPTDPLYDDPPEPATGRVCRGGILWALLGLTVVGLVLAQDPGPAEPAPPRGKMVENVRCLQDPTQTYTLYLPTGWTLDRRRPALLIMDPRGGSVRAARLFEAGAEAHGWIILSSNDTRSDGPVEPNQVAVNALWPEMHLRYSIDPDRIYIAGMSGTTMMAWRLAHLLETPAGVIAAGGRFDPSDFDNPIDVPTFGTAGTTDFNNRRMRAVHAQLREWGAPERLEIHPGSHGWMPPELGRMAVDWHELQAMKRGLRAPDPELVAELLAGELETAGRLEAEGDAEAALRRFEAIVDTYQGLADVGSVRSEVDRLGEDPAVVAARRARGQGDAFELAMVNRAQTAYEAMLDPSVPMPAGRLITELRLGLLERQAAQDDYEGLVARRLLDTFFTQTSFYLYRELIAQEQYARAAATLETSLQIKPDRWDVWYNLACAQARSGGRKRAVESLERAVDLGFSNREHLATDPDLASLRDNKRYQALLERL